MSDLIEQIKAQLRITDYLTAAGYHLEHHGSNGKLRLQKHDSFIIDPDKNRFWWNSHDVHGGIIDLVMELEGVNQEEAIKRLAKRLHQLRPSPQCETRPQRSKMSRQADAVKPPFVLPKAEPKYWPRVYGYLIKERGIAPEVVKWLERSKLIYPDDHANLCYVSKGSDGEPDYVATKGTATGSHFRKVVQGGNFEARAAFNLLDAATPPIGWFICEAAVDAFSIMTLLHRAGKDWRKYAYISLESCYAGPLEYRLTRSPPPPIIWLAQDADEAGMKSRADCRELLAKIGYKGQIIDKLPTLGKDWNDTLKQSAPGIKVICSAAKETAEHENKDKHPAGPAWEMVKES